MSYASGLMMGTAIVRILGQLISGAASGGTGGMSEGRMGGMGSRRAGRSSGFMGLGGFDAAPFGLSDTGMAGGRGAGRPSSGDFRGMSFAQTNSISGIRCGKEIVLVSSLPGRRRYRMAGMTEGEAGLLKESLGKLSCVKAVETNVVSGSLLLLYDEAEKDTIDNIMSKVMGIFAGSGTADKAESRFLKRAVAMEAHVGILTRTVRSIMRDISRWLQAGTGGWLDASSLASLVFFFQGIKKMVITQQFPSGAQMLWWAVSLMRGWRTL